ncbi:MAG TPA: UDP-3-O-(3-hydroxymyristoyl)glucosamine N-acyltransferase [Gemmatimonadaceae bacterium]|nr:UDP-3-O-(3-hydroxymyristoyl)glucosamine N-acyltransferase [Gemmatimonadaceae bacterium]
MSRNKPNGGKSSGEGDDTLTAADIAAIVGGELRGEGKTIVRRVAPIDRAAAGDVTFLGSARYARLLDAPREGLPVVLVSPELADSPGGTAARIVVAKPQEAMLEVLPRLYRPAAATTGVDATVRIGRGARIGRRVSLGPFVVIGEGAIIGDGARLDAHVVVTAGSEIGQNCHLYPHVTIYENTTLGDRVVVHSGARIGSDGFGYVFREGVHAKIPHVGRCVIEHDVEIGANTTIDRGSIDDTVVGAGTKIDNLVQIGHNCRIGKLSLIMAQVGLAGSTHIGDGCIIAGQAGLSGHLTVGDRARLGAQAGVFGDVPAGETWSGYPARKHSESLRAHAALFKLSTLMKRIEKLLEDRGA